MRIITRISSKLNNSGVYCKIIPIIGSQVRAADSIHAVNLFREPLRDGQRVYSKSTDSDAIRKYENALTINVPNICLEFYTDGKSIAKSNSQSVCIFRIRLKMFHVDRTIGVSTNYSDPNITEEEVNYFKVIYTKQVLILFCPRRPDLCY